MSIKNQNQQNEGTQRNQSNTAPVLQMALFTLQDCFCFVLFCLNMERFTNLRVILAQGPC